MRYFYYIFTFILSLPFVIFALDMGHKVKGYSVKDPAGFKKLYENTYNYVISKTKFTPIEVIGILGIAGAIGFALVHGFGRYLARKKYPVELEYEGKVKIYNLFQRIWHWFHVFLVLTLIVTGFSMHWGGPSHSLARVHNTAGITLVIWYIIWILYEIITLDVKQFIVTIEDIKSRMFKQAMFYIKGIFKGEPHPFDTTKSQRLNPLQKAAYAGVMFVLVFIIVFTGFIMAKPLVAYPIWRIIGIENFYIVLYIHLFVAYLIFAFVLGHIYLATTGDKVIQHFKTMITGYHDHYKHKGE